LRFIIVGLIGTLTYFGVSTLLSSRLVELPILWSSLAGFVISLFVSYLGHANFTFQVERRHLHFGSRFVAASVGLAVFASLLAQFVVSKLHVSTIYVTALIAVLYPGASFLIHSMWSFDASSDSR
jgi:putative flippase GtrA